jgi:7,8-dihydropterin-6-yl-methyl-4-(beta-D-ribofuranosyl)aminobenzene 5'-phosphate synthase
MCTEPSTAHHHHPDPPAGLWHDIEPPTTFDLEAVDAVTVTTLVDNLTDALLPDQGPATRPRFGSGQGRPVATMVGGQGPDGLVAEHGFSALVAITKGAVTHRLLFDTGTSPDGAVENMRRLDIDPTTIEAIVCSHGHFDHTTGLDGLGRAIGWQNLPVLIHPHFWRRRRLAVPGREARELPTTSRGALADMGFEIVEDPQPSFLWDHSVLLTGEVARTTGYEPGLPPQQSWLSGRWEPDPLVLDDQALVVDVRDKGLVVLTGCGHAGIVNICRWAQRLTGERPIYAVLGGFHLNGPAFAPLIPRVVGDLAILDPTVMMGGHCTGFSAQRALADRFGEAYVPSAVGTALAV